MFRSNEIISDCDKYHLSCLVDSEFNNQKFSAITLGFYVNGKVNEIWDNESFLIETLYPYLKGLQIELSSSDIHEINCLIDEDVKEELIEMFDTAINLGWFNNVNNITENSDNPSDSVSKNIE